MRRCSGVSDILKARSCFSRRLRLSLLVDIVFLLSARRRLFFFLLFPFSQDSVLARVGPHHKIVAAVVPMLAAMLCWSLTSVIIKCVQTLVTVFAAFHFVRLSYIRCLEFLPSVSDLLPARRPIESVQPFFTRGSGKFALP